MKRSGAIVAASMTVCCVVASVPSTHVLLCNKHRSWLACPWRSIAATFWL